jgi:hypothetical protein
MLGAELQGNLQHIQHAAAQEFVRKGAVPYLYFRHRVPVFVNHINNKLPQNQARNGRQAQQMDG